MEATSSGDEGKAATRSSKLRVVLVAVMTLYALVANNITIANSDYRSVVLQAVGIACLAFVITASIWRRTPVVGRLALALCVLANLATLLDAGGRRLPSVMGW